MLGANGVEGQIGPDAAARVVPVEVWAGKQANVQSWERCGLTHSVSCHRSQSPVPKGRVVSAERDQLMWQSLAVTQKVMEASGRLQVRVIGDIG